MRYETSSVPLNTLIAVRHCYVCEHYIESYSLCAREKEKGISTPDAKNITWWQEELEIFAVYESVVERQRYSFLEKVMGSKRCGPQGKYFTLKNKLKDSSQLVLEILK